MFLLFFSPQRAYLAFAYRSNSCPHFTLYVYTSLPPSFLRRRRGENFLNSFFASERKASLPSYVFVLLSSFAACGSRERTNIDDVRTVGGGFLYRKKIGVRRNSTVYFQHRRKNRKGGRRFTHYCSLHHLQTIFCVLSLPGGDCVMRVLLPILFHYVVPKKGCSFLLGEQACFLSLEGS